MTRTPLRLVLAVAVALTVPSALLTSAPAGATAQHAAGLVIDTGERVVTVYVEFPDGRQTLTGEELLVLADVDAVFADYGSMGRAVCSILGVGSPRDDCFREAERNGLYWNYSRAREGGWERSNQGVSSTTVEHGDVDGWAWGPAGSEPPYHTFEEIHARHAPRSSTSPSPASPPPSPAVTPSDSPGTDDAAPAPEPEAPPEPEPDPATTAPPATSSETSGASAGPADGAAGGPAAASGAPPDPAPSAAAPTPSGDPTGGGRADAHRRADRAEPSPTATGEALLATEGRPDRSGGGPLGWLALLAVLAGLGAATVRRRRARSGGGASSDGR